MEDKDKIDWEATLKLDYYSLTEEQKYLQQTGRGMMVVNYGGKIIPFITTPTHLSSKEITQQRLSDEELDTLAKKLYNLLKDNSKGGIK
jgi:hypothetical protein